VLHSSALRRENNRVFRSMVVFFALQVVEMLGEISAVTSAPATRGGFTTFWGSE